MNKFNRFISTLLITVTIATSIPFQSFAIEDTISNSDITEEGNNGTHGNAGNNDGADGPVGGGGDFSTLTGGGSIGVRFSIIDPNNPSEVISILRDGEPGVVDMLYTQKQQWNNLQHNYTELKDEYKFSSIKTQNITTKNNIDRYCVEDFEKMMDVASQSMENPDTSNMARWMIYQNGAFVMNGTAFKNWFWTNSSGELTNEGLGEALQNTTYTSSGETQVVHSATKEKNSSKNTSQANTVKAPQKKQVSQSSLNIYTEYSDRIAELYSKIMAVAKALAGANILSGTIETKSPYNKFIAEEKSIRNELNLYERQGLLEASTKKILVEALDHERTRMDSWYSKNKNKYMDKDGNILNSINGLNKNKKLSLLDDIFNPMTVYAAETDGAGQGSTVTEEVEDKTKLNDDAHLVTMLRFQDDSGTNVFRIIDTDGETKDLTDGSIERKWILLVEPIVYFTVFPEGTQSLSQVKHSKVYGTISNIADYLGTNPLTKHIKTLNHSAIQTQAWGAVSLDTKEVNGSDTVKSDGKTVTILDSDGNPTYTFVDFSLGGAGRAGTYKTFAELAELNNKDKLVANGNGTPCKVGYGVNMYWSIPGINTPGDNSSQIRTWDEEKFQDGYPGPAPDASNKTEYPEETEFKEQSKKFKIAKFYYIESGLNEEGEHTKEVLTDVQTRIDTPHKVIITNEGDLESEYFWEVVKWSTGKEDIVPQTGDLSRNFEDYVKSNMGSYIGDEPNILTLEPEDSDKVLYVKLVLKVMEKPDVKVVKVYESNGTTDKVEIDDSPEISENTYNINESEEGYNYVKHVKTEEPFTEEPKSWSDVPGGLTESTDTAVIVEEDTHVIYVKYEKNDMIGSVHKIILHEDELSYPYSMNDLKESLDAIWFNFPNKYDSESHRYGSRPNRHTCHWERYLSDSSYHMTLKNGFDYESTNFIGNQGIFSGTEGGKINTSDGERSASISGFTTEQLIPNWLFTLYRDKVRDKVTLYPNKNSTEITNNMGLIGIDSASYTPGNRVAKENSGSFKNSFVVKYFYESLDKKLAYSVDSDCGDHSGGSYNGTENLYIDILNSNYSTADNTLTKYYLGKANTGNTAPQTNNSPFTFDSKSYKAFMSTKLQSNHNIKFYPMIRMTYQTQTTGEQDVFVTSTNESLVLAPTRVEVGVYRDNAKPGLLLDSTQWSTHAKTQSFLTSEGIADKNSVLPGGAIYDLKTSKTIAGKASDNWVGLHTYQVCIPDADMERLSTTEGVLSESTARQQLNDFLSQVENVLDHYQIVQWVTPGIRTTEDSFKSASPVLVCGPGQVNQFGGNTLDRSGKYYLKVDGTGADRSDLDIVGKLQDTTTWTLTSDTDGNVTVANDKGLSLTVSKTEGAGSLLANADIKLLDDKTKVVTNFVNALDRNQGSNREGMKWYNEAFEEIKVIENYAGFQLGFGNGQDARSSALDTKLTGKLEDRRDLYNYSEDSLSDKTRTSQFKTSARSTDGSANGKAPGYIGSMDGLDIIIPNIENLMVSKLFYIPNASVTDLN